MSNQPFISNEKYESTGETKKIFGKILYRIRAKKDFGGIKAGDLGGWIEKESNLSHEGNCWVGGNAHVYNNAWVFDNAVISDDVCVCGNARVHNYTQLLDNAIVFDNAVISDDVTICGNARVCNNARIFSDAEISSSNQYITISPIGSEDGVLTAFKNKDGIIMINRGCFYGTIDKFKSAVKRKHGDNKFGTEYLVALKLITSRFKNN